MWLYGVICGYIGLYVHGYIGLYVVIWGYMWLYGVLCGYPWLYGVILCTALARNSEIDWEGTGGRSLTARTGA